MKKILLVLFCLLLFSCSKNNGVDNLSNTTISDSANSLATDFKIDFSKLEIDADIIDANKTAFTLYLSREVTNEEAVKDLKTICDFIKTFSKRGKIYDYYNQDNEFDYNSINEQTTTLTLKISIKSKDYKVVINRMNGLSYKGSEETYSIYKINILEQDFDNK